MSFVFPNLSLEFYLAAMPVIILGIGSIITMLQTVFPTGGSQPKAVAAVTIASLVASIIACLLWMPTIETPYLYGSYLAGSLGQLAQVAILGVATVVGLFFFGSYLNDKFYRGEIASLYLMVVMGMLVMVTSEDLITLFVGLELSSIGLYAIIGYVHPTRQSQEGAIKYFVLGSFAAALLLFGFALVYAGTGSLRLSEIARILPLVADHSWVRLGSLFVLIGLGFKLALVPFHLWTPDAYEAAPTGITALMATASKIMILVVTLRFFAAGMSELYHVWLPAMMFLALASMILGNIMALVQTSLKRLLAYSSIAHSGYMAVAICAIGGVGEEFPLAAILFYVASYTVISMGTFGIIMWLESDHFSSLQLSDLRGLYKKHPLASFALTVFMFSFAGMPPTVGFMAKFFVFNAALTNGFYSLVIIGVIGSSISFYYYLRVIVQIYMKSEDPAVAGQPILSPRPSVMVGTIVGAAVVMTLLFGTILPNTGLQFFRGPAFEISSTASSLTEGIARKRP